MASCASLTLCCVLQGSNAILQAMTVQVNWDPMCCSWRASILCCVCSTITERSTQPLSKKAVEISLSLSYLLSDYLTQYNNNNNISKVIYVKKKVLYVWSRERCRDAEAVILHIKCSPTFEKLHPSRSFFVVEMYSKPQLKIHARSISSYSPLSTTLFFPFFLKKKGRRQEKERQVRLSVWWMAVELSHQAQRPESAIRKYHHSGLFSFLALVTDSIPFLH